MSAESNGYVSSFELLHCLSSFNPKDAVIASEGANTIDIERAVLLNESGNFILDWEFVNEKTYNWADVNRDLLMIPGVVETGLFVNMATKAYLRMSDERVRTRERNASI
uniref:Uncharacterized protein n=1 Tax=Glossina palpalis gambiensis TaxID=67801 RepID=A0A1B0C5T9_9MUSC